MIKAYPLEETKNRKLHIYHGTDVTVYTVKRGIFIMLDKRIKLTTIEREREYHHKFSTVLSYSVYFASSLAKSKSEQEKANRKPSRTLIATPTWKYTITDSLLLWHKCTSLQHCLL
jgi:hypothetical protein